MDLLIDTSSEINIIKIDYLKGDLIVDKSKRILMRGINRELIIEKINILFTINKYKLELKYILECDEPVLTISEN